MTREEPRYLNDHWTLEDELGIAGVGDHVARIALEAPPPFVIGVTGKWGAGKTSILRRAFATLGGEPIKQAVPLGENRSEAGAAEWCQWRYDRSDRRPALWSDQRWLTEAADHSFFVWYSPWQHQQAENPLIPLVQEIKGQFNDWVRLKEGAPRVTRGLAMGAVHLLERVADGVISLKVGRPAKLVQGTFQSVINGYREAAADPTDLTDGQRFHLLFEDAVEALLQGLVKEDAEGRRALPDGARMVIFIDDLDRCEGETVVALLESIKLYLNTRRCVFVFGMDDGAVLDALRLKWPERGEDGNREYLEKLFQAIVPVPVPPKTRSVDYIARVLRSHGFGEAEARAAEVFELLETNPRKIKNFLNSLCAMWGAAKRSPEPQRARRFILFHYLRLYHRPIWRLIERQPALVGLLLATLEDRPPSETATFVPPGSDGDAQRMFRQFVLHDFMHVLNYRPVAEQDNFGTHHHHLSLDKAVEAFIQRVDRKRSDERFIQQYRSLVTQQNWSEVAAWLDNEFLRIPAANHQEAGER
ncbi:KAP family P-loop NTPase fold protein [Endothiovibrio diazotrophicus]